MKSRNRCLVFVAIIALPGATVLGQAQRSGGSGDSQRFMQQYQQVAAEKTALQTQLDQSKKELEATKAELAVARKERDALKGRPAGIAPAALAQANSSRDTAERNLEQTKQRMNELVNRFRDMATTLRETETERGKLREQVAQRDSAFDRCALNNDELFKINNEVLDRLEHVGLFARASAVEPFTRISRTRNENLADEYHQHAQQLREKRLQPSAAAQTIKPQS